MKSGFVAAFLLLWSIETIAQNLYTEDFLGEAELATTGTAAGTPGGTWSTSAASVRRRDMPIAGEILVAENTGTEQTW